MNEPRLLLEGLLFAEGPRWHDGRFVFSDMLAGKVVAVDLEGNAETLLEVEQWPSGIGWLPDGRMLVVSMRDRKLLRVESDGEVAEHADLSDLAAFHCNDMVVGAQGRAYVGNFGFDLYGGETATSTGLICVEPDGSARSVASGLRFPNGSVITADGSTLIVAETFGRQITAFDIEPDGSLEAQRTWTKLEFFPDGMCLDADQCLWVANPIAPGGFVRVNAQGEVLERIEAGPDLAGFACVLGGPERKHLLLCEAAHGSPDDAKPGNSRLRVVEVDVPGVGWP